LWEFCGFTVKDSKRICAYFGREASRATFIATLETCWFAGSEERFVWWEFCSMAPFIAPFEEAFIQLASSGSRRAGRHKLLAPLLQAMHVLLSLVCGPDEKSTIP
jgi:hypothetical protein